MFAGREIPRHTSRDETSLAGENEELRAPDWLTMIEVRPADGPIESTARLHEALQISDGRSVLLFRRADLGAKLLEEIAGQAADGAGADLRSSFTRWHRAGGMNATNAMPHVHDEFNCHAAVRPTGCPTAFFSSAALIDAVRVTSADRSLPLHIRSQLREAYEESELSGDPSELFHRLHSMRPSPTGSEIEVLKCVRALQLHCQAAGGMTIVPLDADAYGIIGIPAGAVHGRCVLGGLMRETDTAWRYFALDRR